MVSKAIGGMRKEGVGEAKGRAREIHSSMAAVALG